MKVQTFCNQIFGKTLQVWNRDIDRLGPDWLLDELCAHTGTPRNVAYATTLRAYEELLYPKFKTAGTLHWIQTLKMYHRKRQGFGQQYCGRCLAEGPEPYFRKVWRVSLYTTCLKHQCMLHDRCPKCGSGVVFHRMEMGRGSMFDAQPISACHACGFDLCLAPRKRIISYDAVATAWLESAQRAVEGKHTTTPSPKFDVASASVMRQMVNLLTTSVPKINLYPHVLDEMEINRGELTLGRTPFETRSLDERHHLIQMAAWLMVDLEPRLRVALRAKAIRYNHLLKDFADPSSSFIKMTAKFSNWRSRA